MSKHQMKWAALAMSGGVLLQLSGCGLVVAEWLLNAVASQVVQWIVGSLSGTL